MANRRRLTQNNIYNFLQDLSIPQFNADEFFKNASVHGNIGLAISGGGYRSMLTGSGFITKMEEYGLLDCLAYISGLSGGSWILTSLILHDFNFKSLQKWKLDDSLLKGVPNFEVGNKDFVSSVDVDAINDIMLSDDGFYDKLKGQIDVLKRSEVDNVLFEDFYQDLEHDSQLFENKVYLNKRAIDSFTRFKSIVADFFKHKQGTSEERVENLLGSLKNFRQTLEFYINLHFEVRPKKIKGFHLSFTDYWGRALMKKMSSHLSNSQSMSMSMLLENCRNFKEFKVPFPIIVSNCKNSPSKTVVFEFTPFEFGSWDEYLNSFIKLKYLGSKIVSGKTFRCFNGFDDIGFISATSSSIFNNVLVYVWQMAANSSKETLKAIRAIMSTFGLRLVKDMGAKDVPNNPLTRPDYALYRPNPFYKLLTVNNELTNENHLYLVDGGENGENIPIRPLLLPQRKLDVIFALDSSSDSKNYPNGTILRNLYNNFHNGRESLNITREGITSNIDLLPYIPNSKSFVEQQLFSRPVAFGCHLSSYHVREQYINKTTESTNLPPIVIYYANYHHSYSSNTSTFKQSYNSSEIEGMLRNGQDIFGFDANDTYHKCLGCIIIKREYDRRQTTAELPEFCHQCYQDYCFN